MIDVHAHILPKLDNSAKTLVDAESLVVTAMQDGIHTIVCTPHMSAKSQWTLPTIKKRFYRFCSHLQQQGYPITLKLGADIDYRESLCSFLEAEHVLTLNNSRYFLLRLPKEQPPENLEQVVKNCLDKGFVPLITHPERLDWISHHYHRIVALAKQGAWLQITGDSLTGHLGRLPKYWSERLLDEGFVHVIATDAHASDNRAPVLSEAYNAAVKLVGQNEAEQLVELRPLHILDDDDPLKVSAPHGLVTQPFDNINGSIA